VEAGSIRQDLYRRDFTINALAVRLTSPKEGELMDFFGGVLDLRSRQIRVLHANSFIEDPTRIYRAVRFAVRLGFTIEPLTKEYIRYAIASGVYERLRLENQPAPALTTRLKMELNYILQAHYWQQALGLLADLGALLCLHADLVLDGVLWWQLRYISRWLKYLDAEEKLEHWLMRLEVLIASLAVSERSKVARSLQLPKASIERLQKLDKIEETIQERLGLMGKVSEKVFFLRAYTLPNLILIAARSDKIIRRVLWEYITIWSKIKAPLNGDDLRAMGYRAGPEYKIILDGLLQATLDGEVSDRISAEEFIRRI
jgi:tRNA nucleotidyltransferase (CCA-adding enzyme)